MKINKTKDYSIFKTEKGNRKVDMGHVRRLVRSIEQKNMLQANPIIVNSSMKIIDGQHRLAAAKILKIPVYYVNFDPASLVEIQALNANTRNWRIIDFMNSYVELGKKDYIRFKEFQEKYGMPYSTCIEFLSGVNSTGELRSFKEGNFTIMNWEEAVEIADEIMEMKPYINEYAWGSTRLYDALLHLVRKDEIPLMNLTEKLQAYGLKIYPARVRVEYKRQFEDILNKGRVGKRLELT